MPELPEVETTLRGIKPHIDHQKLNSVDIRHTKLRWPIPIESLKLLKGHILLNIERRGKYLLFSFDSGTIILHLGMSGKLCVLSELTAPKKHDHIDLLFENKKLLRFTDPRRFGAVLFTKDNPFDHSLLKSLGPEPLTKAFNGEYLYKRSRGKKVSVKAFIMDSKIVVGVGNIYATEALFTAKIRPLAQAKSLSLAAYQQLAMAIKTTLKNAIKKGGTTLKDFMMPSGKPGYFSIELKVYGRAGKPCPTCGLKLKSARIGQRSTVYCSKCQK